MHIKATSYFNNAEHHKLRLVDWVKRVENSNHRKYGQKTLDSCLGKTQVFTLNADKQHLPGLVIFSSEGLSVLSWDLDKQLDPLLDDCRIFLVETNGQANLSDGNSPDVRSLDYGHWASEVLKLLGLHKTFVAGASFGGLVAMKLAVVHPEKIISLFLLNPAGLQAFSMRPANLIGHFLTALIPSRASFGFFMRRIMFCAPEHIVSEASLSLLCEYYLMAARHFKDNTESAYNMREQLHIIKSQVYLLTGANDQKYPERVSMENAKRYLKNLEEVKSFQNVAHGIEMYPGAIHFIAGKIRQYN